jgi:hypothetical protein
MGKEVWLSPAGAYGEEEGLGGAGVAGLIGVA